MAATGRCAGIVRLLVACACRESSPKRGALRVLLGPSGLHAVSCEYAVDAGLSIGMRAHARNGSATILALFQWIRSRAHRFRKRRECPKAAFSEVLFKQHTAENCIAECSTCLFVVACRSMCVSVGVRRRGASPGRPFRSFRCLGDNERQRKGRTVRGAKGTFQGEQRPRRSIPPTTTYGG